jgi:hypothetical protein
MSDQANSYLRRAATLIELASTIEDTDLRCELIDTALLYERLADFAADREAKQESDASKDHD